VQIVSTALAAQRSGSARAASSGPTALPSPRQADNFFFFSFFRGSRSSRTHGATMQRGRAAPRQSRSNKQLDPKQIGCGKHFSSPCRIKKATARGPLPSCSKAPQMDAPVQYTVLAETPATNSADAHSTKKFGLHQPRPSPDSPSLVSYRQLY
jgi:hypothetical protein